MATSMDNDNIREIRIDPIVPTQSVLISTSRGRRPLMNEPILHRDELDYVQTCPFCRGNEHLTPPSLLQVPESGKWDIRVVENLYPVLDDDRLPVSLPPGMQQAIEGYGHHEVVIDHFSHGIPLQQMDQQHLALLLAVYRDRMDFFYNNDPRVKYILVYKNSGKAAGGSMEHTHSQLIAMPVVPHNIQDELEWSREFYQKNGECIFCVLCDETSTLKTTLFDKSSGEKRQNYETGKYVVERGKQFVAIKPFASRYEWEVHILPIKHQSSYLKVTAEELDDLSWVLRRTMARLQTVVGNLQYNYFFHSTPHVKDKKFAESYHWHIEICPRTTIPSGFELGSGLFVNTISPEEAAAKLRQVVLED
jgi:UDPglucose--hexose-1-phosphate uridylyltransferase